MPLIALFQYYQNAVQLQTITRLLYIILIFDWCPHSLAVVTPVKSMSMLNTGSPCISCLVGQRQPGHNC